MAIQNRRGAYVDLNPAKAVPGELLVVQSGDPNATDGKAVYMTFGTGDIKQLATKSDVETAVADVAEDLLAELDNTISTFTETTAPGAVADVADEGAAQITAIGNKGDEVLGSIPSDYSTLSGDVSDLKSALEDLQGGSYNGLVYYRSVPYGFITVSGEDSQNQTSYWNTGLVFVEIGSQSILSSNYTIYKTAFFDASGVFKSTDNTHSANVPIPTGTRYVKVQFKNSVVAYADKNKVDLYVDNIKISRISNEAIQENGITFDKLSESLQSSILSFDGDRRYLYEGERIQLRPTFDYKRLITVDSSQQAGCVYGNNLFKFKANGTFALYDLVTKTKIADGTLAGGLQPHCNTACFGAKYVETDEFPLVYLNAYNATGLPKGTCYVYRISNGETLTASLIQTITIGFTEDQIWKSGDSDIRPYGNFCVDMDGNYLYVYTLRDTNPVTRFFKFTLPNISEETVTLNISDILDYFDCEYFNYIQDNVAYYGKLYICSGYGTAGGHGFIRVIDPMRKEEITRIDLYNANIKIEPEIIDIYNKQIICGATNVYIFTF